MKLKKYRLIFTALAALALLATACSKIDEDADNGYNSATGTTVSVTLPIGIAEQETHAKPATSRTTAATATNPSPEEGFTVSFDEPMTTTDAPATRAIAKELTNVWVLQFDNAGDRVSTDCISSLAAGAPLTASKLQIGTGHTIYVVANGPALGSTDAFLFLFSPLADFEGTMLYTTAVTDAAKLPLSGKLTGVSVVDLGDGTGKISLPDATPATVVMRRIHAEVTLTVDFGVTGYDLTDAQLYNVPVGTNYGWNNATTTFPNNTNDVFDFIDTADPGMSSLTPTTSGTKTTYKWFIGDNRRGEVPGLTAPSHRHSGKAPAYSTFARITLTNSTTDTKKIYYDLYLGSDNVTNFDVKRNYTYTVTATIKGTESFQEALVGVDARVSGSGFPIWLTDNRADSPLEISPKSMESTLRMAWGPTTLSISGAQDIFNGKANTDAIIAASATDYPAAKYCRDQGSQWDLPALAQLVLMSVYLPAIAEADRPNNDDYCWSSTEESSIRAWQGVPWFGASMYETKDKAFYVRCVRNGVNPSWKYPKVEGSNTIVSRDAAGGIKSDALLTTAEKNWLKNTNFSTTTYNEASIYNKVSEKFQVASTDASTSSTWAEAYTKCKSYSADGNQGSWRVPTQRELLLIWMLKSKLTGFDNITEATLFWSGTEFSQDTSLAYEIFLFSGLTGPLTKEDVQSVRCVRDL